MNFKSNIIVLMLIIASNTFAQEQMSLMEAVNVAVSENRDIKIAKNNLKIAENNASILNSGYLPTVTGNAAGQKKLEDTHVQFAGGVDRFVTDAKTDSYNYGVTLNYTIFNGLGRHYNYKKFEESYDLAELQSRSVIENTLINLIKSYYDISKLQSRIKNQEQTLKYSKERLDRTQNQYDFGQSGKIDLLRSQVDFNTDTINYLDLKRQLDVAQRNFNVLLSRDVKIEILADTNVVFNIDIVENEILDLALSQNVDYLIANQNLTISTLDVKSNRSGFMPKIDISGGYNYNNTQSDGGAFLLNETDGFNARAGLTWNIFDGGMTNTKVQNAKIAKLNAQEQLELLKSDIERQVSNAYVNYKNALIIMNAEEINLQTNRLNFDYSLEKFQLGQINSLDFRKAQVDLLDSENRYYEAKLSAKISELELMKLAGVFLQELEN
jgi:outer membrane protein TolC